MSKRLISHSEVSTALDCHAKHAFAYTGRLTGGRTLRRKQPALKLREGRAWGRAVAALHGAVDSKASTLPGLAVVPGSDGDVTAGGLHVASGGVPTPTLTSHGVPVGGRLAVTRALRELAEALDEDAERQMEYGLYDGNAYWDTRAKLTEVLHHYDQTTEPLHVHSPELELQVPLPSRGGQRASNRFVFHGYLDALTEIDGRLWIVEYKLRDRLTDYEQLVRQRQFRRYVWAAERQLDREVMGVIVDERLNQEPKPARILKNGKPSHTANQLCTHTAYRRACIDAGIDLELDTYEALMARQWQQRHRLTFTRFEIDEAGQELVAAAQQISSLDAGHLYPVRNVSAFRCPSCPFKDICDQPDDAEVIGLSYSMHTPKRLQTPMPTEDAA